MTPPPTTMTSGLTRPMLIPVRGSTGVVDQAAQPQVFAGPRFLVERTGGHLSQAGRRRPLDDAIELVDLAVDVAIRLEDLEQGGPLTQDLLEIGTVHNREK